MDTKQTKIIYRNRKKLDVVEQKWWYLFKEKKKILKLTDRVWKSLKKSSVYQLVFLVRLVCSGSVYLYILSPWSIIPILSNAYTTNWHRQTIIQACLLSLQMSHLASLHVYVHESTNSSGIKCDWLSKLNLA